MTAPVDPAVVATPVAVAVTVGSPQRDRRRHVHLPDPVGPEGPIDPDSRSRLASAVDELAPTADVTHPTAFAAAVDHFDRHVDGWFERLRGERWADELFEIASRLGDWSLHLDAAQRRPGPLGAHRPRAGGPQHHGALHRVGVGQPGHQEPVQPGAARSRPRGGRAHPPAHHLQLPEWPRRAAFTAAGLLTAGHPARKVPVYALAVIVSSSRIHTRMHHTSDVVAGAAIGIGIARAARRWWPAP